jgi:hypothetical protein
VEQPESAFCRHNAWDLRIMELTVSTFKLEIAQAVKSFEKYVVCLEKTPEQFESSMRSLMEKAINAYLNRGEGLRHGIALDKQVTIILSQTENERPLCGIYFNLHSPYHKAAAGQKTNPSSESDRTDKASEEPGGE